MIICRSRKYIFLKVPKTGSTSVCTHIAKNSIFSESDSHFPFNIFPAKNIQKEYCFEQHPNLDFVLQHKILKKEEMETMDVYGIMREPYSRTLSLFGHIVAFINGGRQNVANLTSTQIATIALDLILKSNNKFKIKINQKVFFPAFPQSFWLKHDGHKINNIIVYPHFESFLKKIDIDKEMKESLMGGPPHIREELDDDIRKAIRNLYSVDFELWNSLG